MTLLPTFREACQVNPGRIFTLEPAVLPDLVVQRLMTEVFNRSPGQLVMSRLEPFEAFSIWLAAWLARQKVHYDEVCVQMLIKQLATGDLPEELDSNWLKWEDTEEPLAGFDIVFCDHYLLIWKGCERFYDMATGLWRDRPLYFVPLQKLGLDATVLFARGMKLVAHARREAERATTQHGTDKE